MALSLPRGTRDYGPAEAIAFRHMLSTIEETFRKFGFYPIETPSIETKAVLSTKVYGSDSSKEIYIMEGGEEGLRYDLTVPLARYMAMNRDIPLPFRRYQLGRIWRRDEPQHMRSREFMQADIDIIGSSEVSSDAEIVAAASMAIESLGISDYSILINSRKVLDCILDLFNISKELHIGAIRAIDKMDKLSVPEVFDELGKAGIDSKAAEGLLGFVKDASDPDSVLHKLGANVPQCSDEIKRLESLLKSIKAYGIRGNLVIDLSLARGLDYYTGAIWEIVVYAEGKRLPSIAAGGRYDGLIAAYSKAETPAVGISIGADRVFEILGSHAQKTFAKVFVAHIGDENIDYALFVANKLRNAGIAADLDVTKRGIAKQLGHANSLGIRYSAILGNKEMADSRVRLRNMESGEEEVLGIDEAIEKLKSG